MNTLLLNKLRLLLSLAGFALLSAYGTAQTVTPSWASNTFSASSGDTSSTNYNSLVFSINLPDPEETDSFSLFLTDGNDYVVMKIGEYVMIKHENGFYYVEEKTSHDLTTVLGNTVYFTTNIHKDKLSKIKVVNLKILSKGNERTRSGSEKTVKTKVPKIKKK